jgi:hypothetical protein
LTPGGRRITERPGGVNFGPAAPGARIIYRELWPGIGLVYQGTFERLKYEFVAL